MKVCPGPPEWHGLTPLARRTIWVFIALFLLAVAAAGVHELVGGWITQLVAGVAAAAGLLLVLVALAALYLAGVIIAVRDGLVGFAYILGAFGRWIGSHSVTKALTSAGRRLV
jgi:hypothetical protein